MLPCYVIDRTLGADVLRDIRTMVTGAGLGFLMIVVEIVLIYFVGILINLDSVLAGALLHSHRVAIFFDSQPCLSWKSSGVALPSRYSLSIILGLRS